MKWCNVFTLVFTLAGYFWVFEGNLRKQWKNKKTLQVAFLIKIWQFEGSVLVAGEGFEPTTFGL